MNLRQMAEHMMEGAKGISLAGNEVNAAMMVWDTGEDRPVIIGIPQYAQHKAESLAIMGAALQFYRSDRFAFVCEAWMAVKKTDEQRQAHNQPGYAVRNDPDRVSALVCIAKSRDGEQVSLICEIKDTDGKRTFEEMNDAGNGHMMSMLDNLFGAATVQ